MSSQSSSEGPTYKPFLEELREHYEVDECEEHTEAGFMKLNLPYTSPDWISTEYFVVKLTVDKNDIPFLEILTAPKCLNLDKEKLQMPLIKRALDKDKWSLLDLINAFYLHIERLVNPLKPDQIMSRDFAFPMYDPRHFGRHPPSKKYTWRLYTLTQSLKTPNELLKEGEEVLVREGCHEDSERDMRVIRRADDHLPNKYILVPSCLLKR